MAYVADPVIERNAIVFIHAYPYKRVWRPVFLNVWASFLVSLEWIYALSIDFLHLIIWDIFDRIYCSRVIVHTLLGVRLIVAHLLDKVVAEFDLLGSRNAVILFVLLARDIDIVLNV